MSTDQPGKALVPIGPERRRILRDLMARPRLASDQIELYIELLHDETHDAIWRLYDVPHRTTEERAFTRLVMSGVPAERAQEEAKQTAAQAWRDLMPTEGQRERERRRARREAVTALDGRTAVTTGMLAKCIVCDKQLRSYWRRDRSDRAYCSPACRQKAYRQRKAREARP